MSRHSIVRNLTDDDPVRDEALSYRRWLKSPYDGSMSEAEDPEAVQRSLNTVRDVLNTLASMTVAPDPGIDLSQLKAQKKLPASVVKAIGRVKKAVATKKDLSKWVSKAAKDAIRVVDAELKKTRKLLREAKPFADRYALEVYRNLKDLVDDYAVYAAVMNLGGGVVDSISDTDQEYRMQLGRDYEAELKAWTRRAGRAASALKKSGEDLTIANLHKHVKL